MELFLNILWVLITLAGVIVWRIRWTLETRAQRHAAWREWTAFVCATVLLFFVVSLTDDLHAELMLIEECSTSRRHATCLACAHYSLQADHSGATTHAWAIPQVGPAVESLPFGAFVLPTSENGQLLLNARRSVGRAPPIAVL